MIISNVLFCLIVSMAISCSNSQVKLKNNTQIVKDSVEQTALKLTELYDNKNCKEFVKAFPNTFQKFNELYGYDDEKGARILYSKAEHIPYFFNCSEVSDREKLNKVVKIGINGKWDADSINLFQDSTFELIKVHPEEAKEIIDALPDDKAASFWHFLFDGPAPNDKEKVKKVDLLSNLLGKQSNQSKLLLEQYQKVRTDWENP